MCGKVVGVKEHEILCMTKFGMCVPSYFHTLVGMAPLGILLTILFPTHLVLLCTSLGHKPPGCIRRILSV